MLSWWPVSCKSGSTWYHPGKPQQSHFGGSHVALRSFIVQIVPTGERKSGKSSSMRITWGCLVAIAAVGMWDIFKRIGRCRHQDHYSKKAWRRYIRTHAYVHINRKIICMQYTCNLVYIDIWYRYTYYNIYIYIWKKYLYIQKNLSIKDSCKYKNRCSVPEFRTHVWPPFPQPPWRPKLPLLPPKKLGTTAGPPGDASGCLSRALQMSMSMGIAPNDASKRWVGTSWYLQLLGS